MCWRICRWRKKYTSKKTAVIFMGILSQKRLPYRLLVVAIILFCLSMLCIFDCWMHRSTGCRDNPTQNQKDTEEYNYWKTEYENRVQRVRNVCAHNKIFGTEQLWNATTNKHMGSFTSCTVDKCTVIVDEQKLFYCFNPKVATTFTKRFFLLDISDVPRSDVLQKAKNQTALHILADHTLIRVSPAYYPPMQLNRFYKIMFVRHPFDRLVSAFRNKAEQPRNKMGYFYSTYWDPIMKKLRPKGAILDRITFKEFVWHLLHTTESEYEPHWALFSRRCDPCYVDYDFIGKLETARHDFPYAFRKAGLEFNPEWANHLPTTNQSVTLTYFATIPEVWIQKLYEIYRLDFELFGYSVSEFLPKSVMVS